MPAFSLLVTWGDVQGATCAVTAVPTGTRKITSAAPAISAKRGARTSMPRHVRMKRFVPRRHFSVRPVRWETVEDLATSRQP